MITVQTFTAVINHVLPEPQAGLLNGILFGTKATISKELYQALVTTGTLHIVALSGMNITILTSLVNFSLLRFISRRIASLLTILVISGFVWFVGPSPSVIRAAIMGTISLIAVIFGRQYWALLSWILAVGIMLLLNLNWAGDLSFQLSIFATLGIILFGKKQRNVLFDDLWTTLAAQIFTIPIILWKFHRISLISPLSNVLIGWIIQPLTVLGLFTAVLGFIFLPFGQILAWVSWVPLTYLLTVVELTSKIPFASIGN